MYSQARVVTWAAKPKGDRYAIGDLWLKGLVRTLAGIRPDNAGSDGIASTDVSGGVDPPYLDDGDATPSPVGTPPPPVLPPARVEQGRTARLAPEANEAGSGQAGGADLCKGRSAEDVERVEKKAVQEKFRKLKTVPHCIGRLKEAIHQMEAKMVALDSRCATDLPRETKGQLYAAHWRCTSLLAEHQRCLDTLERMQKQAKQAGNRYTLAEPFQRATKVLETSQRFLEECSALEARAELFDDFGLQHDGKRGVRALMSADDLPAAVKAWGGARAVTL